MKAVTFLVLLTLPGCATAPPTDAGPTARLGQFAYTNGPRVRPIEVVEDSRCPALVRCVWAGRVRVLVLIELRGGNEELRTTLTLGESLSVADGTLTLVAAEPAKMQPGAIDPRAYRFSFRFDGGL